MIFLDTETCGFVGPIVLFQYRDTNGSNNVIHHHVWHEPVSKTLTLIERLVNDDIVLFNAVFDWFHIVKLYNLFSRIGDKSSVPKADEVAHLNSTSACGNQLCLKPRSILDLMLVVRKSKWQTLMDRDDIVIKRVPFETAHMIADELQTRLDIPEIYFAKRAQGYNWNVEPSDENGFSNVTLKFAASFGLKALARELFKVSTIEYPLPRDFYPSEESYNPYGTGWTEKIHKHIAYWKYNPTAIQYATDDVIYLERLYHSFMQPAFNDTDSKLTIAVANARWEGFEIDIGAMSDRYLSNADFLRTIPINYNSSHEVKRYLLESAPITVQSIIRSTDKDTLKSLSKMRPIYPELGDRADSILKARKLDKENTVLHRLITTGRFCPELKIIGTRSGRMSGGATEGDIASLNPQGIQRNPEFRRLFTLAGPNEVLSGGDFESQEVTVIAAWCKDENLNRELGEGKSFHGLWGSDIYGVDYQDVMLSKGLISGDIYAPAKQSAFAAFYGAQIPKLASSAGIDEERMEEGYERFVLKYPKVGVSRAAVFDAFCSMRQPGGIGTKIIWKEPADYIESLLGFKRYFTLENAIVRTIFQLAERLPNSVQGDRIVKRNKREQTVRGATQSALFGVAFQLQAANMRSAANHIIQSTGGELTKEVQARAYAWQPQGIHRTILKMMNIHDEIMAVHDPAIGQSLKLNVEESIESFRKLIPLIKMEWKTGFKNWGEK